MNARDLISLMPGGVRAELRRISESYSMFYDKLSEIHLRLGARSSIVLNGKNVPIETRVSRGDMDAMIKDFSHGSLYAYRDSMLDGYIMLPDGIRVGICGRARYEGGRLLGVGEVLGVSVRIPHILPGVEEIAYREFCSCGGGMLIYSPPGVGKTTLLRALSRRLSSGRGARRVVIIDERDEFSVGGFFADSMVDILIGYPKGEGVEVALRTLSPEIIVTDEIGDTGEATALLRTVNAGVPVIASAHAASFGEAMRKRSVKLLSDAGVFVSAVGIFRGDGNIYSYICDRITQSERRC